MVYIVGIFFLAVLAFGFLQIVAKGSLETAQRAGTGEAPKGEVVGTLLVVFGVIGMSLGCMVAFSDLNSVSGLDFGAKALFVGLAALLIGLGVLHLQSQLR